MLWRLAVSLCGSVTTSRELPSRSTRVGRIRSGHRVARFWRANPASRNPNLDHMKWKEADLTVLDGP